jgi:hypothetical protein
MPKRWYLPFYGFGRPVEIVNRISNLVDDYDLAGLVPRICIERRQRNRSREFYFFLGIHGDSEGQIPREVEPILHYLTTHGYHKLEKALTFSDIKKMTGGEVDITKDFTRRIKYRPPPAKPQEDPLSFFEEQRQILTDHSFEPFNHLLYWLTATGQGSWEIFTSTCKHLLPSDSRPPRQLFRRLRMLGHAEYMQQGNKWVVAPACLVAIDALSSPHRCIYYLAGQRTLELESLVSQYAEQVDSVPHLDVSAPICKRFMFSSNEAVHHVTSSIEILHMAGNASIKLGEVLPDIHGWQHTLQTIDEATIPIGLYHFDKWEDNMFVEHPFEFDSGLYHLRRRDVSDGPELTLFYEAESANWLRGDWYGLRYLAQYIEGHLHKVHYYPTDHTLAVPLATRWPDIYERALTLASGQLPNLKDDWLYFSNVSEYLCRVLASKLKSTVVFEENYDA